MVSMGHIDISIHDKHDWSVSVWKTNDTNKIH